MLKLKPHRKHLTQAQREQIIHDYHQSHLTQRQFAAQAGLGLSTLQLWLRKAATRSHPPARPFVQIPNLLAPARSPYRLHLEGGMELEIGSGFVPEELTSLLQVVRGL